MNDASTVARLAKALGHATRSAKFCAVGSLPALDPGLDVEGLGAVKFPLKRATAKELVALCRAAPYGKGTATLVNKNVRNTFELDPQKFHLSDAWNEAIVGAMKPIAAQLGLPAEQLEPRLYKLLVYEKGGFFLPHRDSEKHDRMVASLVVVLPNPFGGGTLIVRHGTAEQTLPFTEAARGQAPCYAAFYADCEHEVQRVTRGARLCLAYNLVLKAQRGKPAATAPAAPTDVLAAALGAWFASRPAEPLVFALDHHYTQRGLSLDLLKGADRHLADLLVAAAEKTDCLVHLAQVSRHLSQFADDGSLEDDYYSRRSYSKRRHEIEIGETYEDDLNGTEWVDLSGQKQPWRSIAFKLSAIVAAVPIDEWKPTSEEFEGYTGNAGNTLDRWYHRSALVLWPRAHHFDVIASAGAASSIPLFGSMAAKLDKTPKKRFEAARLDCIRFVRAIIAQWPRRTNRDGYFDREEAGPYDAFLKALLSLHDRDSVALLLATVAKQDHALRLKAFVVAVCREFGWSAFAQELQGLLAARPDREGRQEVPFRDIEWLAAFCCEQTADPKRPALASDLCKLAAERFCKPFPPRPAYHLPYFRREASVSETSLPWLLKAIATRGREEDLARVVRFVQEAPDEFSLDNCQVPCLKALIPWTRKQLGSVPPPLASWLTAVREQLETATPQQPTPPSDWARPATVPCRCEYCAPLKAFLADPANEVGRIAAREDVREHLIGIIRQHQCDVKYTLERKSSPYALLFTKTTGSFDRAVQRFEANRRLSSSLASL
jgi:hypothetical protein